MFSKPNKPSVTDGVFETVSQSPDAAAIRRGPKIAALLAEGLRIEGGISGDGELHVDGAIRGDVRVTRLTVSETGDIEGTVEAEIVECRGRIVGSLSAKQVRLYGAAHVDGDITHEQLTIEAGAYFQGRSLKFPAADQAPTLFEIPHMAAE